MSDPAHTPTTIPHPAEILAMPKGQRVWVVLRQEGVHDEEKERWVAGVYTDRRLAEAALGNDTGWVLTVPLNHFGRFRP